MSTGSSYSQKDGSRVVLGQQVGNRGGEGIVYSIDGKPTTLAKIYHPGKADERADKIAAMVDARLHEKLGFAAFPRDQLYSGSTSRLRLSKPSFSGFTMERIENAFPIHQLWNTSDRAQYYPQADFRFLVRAASNLAQNFARLHAEGIVIGDVNESGIWVSGRAYVRFIDCDSFQATLNGKTFPCLVQVEEYTAPELMGNKKARQNRTPNHDNFALAVMIFRLLMAGQHPFNARYTGPGESPTRGRLISEFKYPYARSSLGRMFEAPPHAPDVSVFSDEMGEAFEDAFGKSGVQKRPTADKWAELIQRYDDALIACARNPAHFHAPQTPKCPWCHVEKKRGQRIFATKTITPKPKFPNHSQSRFNISSTQALLSIKYSLNIVTKILFLFLAIFILYQSTRFLLPNLFYATKSMLGSSSASEIISGRAPESKNFFVAGVVDTKFWEINTLLEKHRGRIKLMGYPVDTGLIVHGESSSSCRDDDIFYSHLLCNNDIIYKINGVDARSNIEAIRLIGKIPKEEATVNYFLLRNRLVGDVRDTLKRSESSYWPQIGLHTNRYASIENDSEEIFLGVTKVLPYSPAYMNGIRDGDIIYFIDNERVFEKRSGSDLMRSKIEKKIANKEGSILLGINIVANKEVIEVPLLENASPNEYVTYSLGVRVSNLTESDRVRFGVSSGSGGVLVTELLPHNIEKNPLKVDDVILSHLFRNFADVMDFSLSIDKSRDLSSPILILRDGEHLSITCDKFTSICNLD